MGTDVLGAEINRLPRDLAGPSPAANSRTRLKETDVESSVNKPFSSGEPGKACADDDHIQVSGHHASES
jgi:hypothetical protein